MEATAPVEVAFTGHLNGAKPKTKRTTVAIVGFAPSSMGMAPVDNLEVEIWGINEIYLKLGRIDRLFELHEHKYLTQKQRNPHHLAWLQQASIPIYTYRKYRDIPQSIPFPYEKVTKAFQTRYFTNTISWLIAFAILEGFKRIELWGVDMAMDEEYGAQRPSCEYFVGIAVGMGIDVHIPPQSSLLKTTFLYGKEEAAEEEMQLKLQARKDELLGKLKAVQDERDKLTLQEHIISGNLGELDHMRRQYLNDLGDRGGSK